MFILLPFFPVLFFPCFENLQLHHPTEVASFKATIQEAFQESMSKCRMRAFTVVYREHSRRILNLQFILDEVRLSSLFFPKRKNKMTTLQTLVRSYLHEKMTVFVRDLKLVPQASCTFFACKLWSIIYNCFQVRQIGIRARMVDFASKSLAQQLNAAYCADVLFGVQGQGLQW